VDNHRLVNYRGDVFDHQQPAPGHTQAVNESNVPGLWASILTALLFGTLSWFLFNSETGTANTESSAGERLELAQVDDQDIAPALNTIGGSRSFQARFKQGQANCPQPLAWVSLTRAKPGPPMTIRLRSGNYISPTFNLADAPVRVAIPYPAPYEIGQGTLSVIATGGDAIVSLLPPWRAPGGASVISHQVTWRPRGSCQR